MSAKRILAAPVLGNARQRAQQEAAIASDMDDAEREHAFRLTPQRPSTPLDPTWPPPPRLIGQVVLYVMPDGTDREALILALRGDNTATLNVQIALSGSEQIQRQQVTGAPLGATGEPGTWREAPV